MFASVAKGFKEIRAEEKATVGIRCERAVELTQNHKTSVYWCNRNEESDLLNELDSDAVEIRGSMSIDKKEDILLSFSKGDIDRLITKASMTSFGLNWQHCNHTVYFPTYSYEQYYQAIRRFWRFGQTKPVTVDLVLSDGQTSVMQSLKKKTDKAIQLYQKLTDSVNKDFEYNYKEFNKTVELPNFI